MNSSDAETEERVITPEEELIANSVSNVEQLIENAPVVPPRPDLKEEVAEEAVKEVSVESPQSISDNDEINSIPTKVSVSYRTHEKSLEDKGTLSFATNQEELTSGNAHRRILRQMNFLKEVVESLQNQQRKRKNPT